eukprot:jgi/Botrbrau1/5449/Bobra.27_1s0002.1
MIARRQVLAAAVSVTFVFAISCHAQRPSMFGSDESFRLIVQRTDTVRPFSGEFGKGGSSPTADGNSPVANLNKTFAGRAVPLEVLKVDQTKMTPAQMCEYLKQHNPDVTICVADFRVWIDGPAPVPNDPDLPHQWALNDVKVGSVWAANQFGHSDIKVCMVDTGSDLTHQDLQSNLWKNPGEANAPGASADNGYVNGKDDDGNGIVDDIYGVNFVNGANGGNPQDDNGHGSFVAGVVGAVGNNAFGISGLNQVVSIISCKFMDAQGNGWASDAVRCFDYCIKMGAHVISNSWGGVENSDALQAAVKHIGDRGILMVASAGNEGVDTDATDHFPSTLTDDIIIAVAAANRSGGIWYKSNYGKTTVDIAAPGVQVIGLAPGNQFQTMTGTSMATPHVAGAAALLLAQYADNGFDISVTGNNVGKGLEVKRLLMSSADPMPGVSGVKLVSGHLNVAAAMNLVPMKRAASEGFGEAAAEGEMSSSSGDWRSGVGDILPQTESRPSGGLAVMGGGAGTFGTLIRWPDTRQGMMPTVGVRPAVQVSTANVAVPAEGNGTYMYPAEGNGTFPYPYAYNTNGTAPGYMNGPGGQVNVGASGNPAYPTAGLPILPIGASAANSTASAGLPQLPGIPGLPQMLPVPASNSASQVPAAGQASNLGASPAPPTNPTSQVAAGGPALTANANQPVTTGASSLAPASPSQSASAGASFLPSPASTTSTSASGTNSANLAVQPGSGQGASTGETEPLSGANNTQPAGTAMTLGQSANPSPPAGTAQGPPQVSSGAPLVPGATPLGSNGTVPEALLSGGGPGSGAAQQAALPARGAEQTATSGLGQGAPAAPAAGGSGAPGNTSTGQATGTAAGSYATTGTQQGTGVAGQGALANVSAGSPVATTSGGPGGIPGGPGGIPGNPAGGPDASSGTGPVPGAGAAALPIIPLPADPGSITGPLSSLFGSTVAGTAMGAGGEARGKEAAAEKVVQMVAQFRSKAPVVMPPPDPAMMAMGSFPIEHGGEGMVPGPPPPPGPPPSYVNPEPGAVGGSRIRIDQRATAGPVVLTEGSREEGGASPGAPPTLQPTVSRAHSRNLVPGIFEIALPYRGEEAAAVPPGRPIPASAQPTVPVTVPSGQLADIQALEADLARGTTSATPAVVAPLDVSALLSPPSAVENPSPREDGPSSNPTSPSGDTPAPIPTPTPVMLTPTQTPSAPAATSIPSSFSVNQTPAALAAGQPEDSTAEKPAGSHTGGRAAAMPADPPAGLFADIVQLPTGRNENGQKPAARQAQSAAEAGPAPRNLAAGSSGGKTNEGTDQTSQGATHLEESSALENPLPSLDSFPGLFFSEIRQDRLDDEEDEPGPDILDALESLVPRRPREPSWVTDLASPSPVARARRQAPAHAGPVTPNIKLQGTPGDRGSSPAHPTGARTLAPPWAPPAGAGPSYAPEGSTESPETTGFLAQALQAVAFGPWPGPSEVQALLGESLDGPAAPSQGPLGPSLQGQSPSVPAGPAQEPHPALLPASPQWSPSAAIPGEASKGLPSVQLSPGPSPQERKPSAAAADAEDDPLPGAALPALSPAHTVGPLPMPSTGSLTDPVAEPQDRILPADGHSPKGARDGVEQAADPAQLQTEPPLLAFMPAHPSARSLGVPEGTVSQQTPPTHVQGPLPSATTPTSAVYIPALEWLAGAASQPSTAPHVVSDPAPNQSLGLAQAFAPTAELLSVTYASSPQTPSYASSPQTLSYASSPQTLSYASNPPTLSYASNPPTLSYASSPQTLSQASNPQTLSHDSTPQMEVLTALHTAAGSNSSPAEGRGNPSVQEPSLGNEGGIPSYAPQTFSDFLSGGAAANLAADAPGPMTLAPPETWALSGAVPTFWPQPPESAAEISPGSTRATSAYLASLFSSAPAALYDFGLDD